jgi:hypothetical protein
LNDPQRHDTVSALVKPHAAIRSGEWLIDRVSLSPVIL